MESSGFPTVTRFLADPHAAALAWIKHRVLSWTCSRFVPAPSDIEKFDAYQRFVKPKGKREISRESYMTSEPLYLTRKTLDLTYRVRAQVHLISDLSLRSARFVSDVHGHF